MRTHRLFVCYFLVLAVGLAASAFVDRTPDGFSDRGTAMTDDARIEADG